ELAHYQLQLRHFLFVCLTDHDSPIDAGQRRAHVVEEFDRAGAIDERVGIAEEIGRSDGELDRHAMMPGLGATVSDGGPRLDRPLPLDGSRAGQNGFQQRGLSALERADERNASRTLWSAASVLSH